MVNKLVALKCTSVYASNEKKPSAKFHFPLKNAGLNRQYFEDKYLLQGKKCTLQWPMNPVSRVYPQNLVSKHLRYHHSKLFGVFPETDSSQMNY